MNLSIKTFLGVTALALTVSVFAQPASIKWASSFKTGLEARNMKLLRSTESGYAFLEYSEVYLNGAARPKMLLDKLDLSGNLISQKELQITINGKSYYTRDFIAIDDKIIAFPLVPDNERKKFIVYGVIFNLNGTQTDEKELTNVAFSANQSYSEVYNSYFAKASEDESSVLLIAMGPFTKGDEDGNTKYLMFDTDLEHLWSTSFTSQFRFFQDCYFKVPNSSQVFVLDNENEKSVLYTYDDEFEEHHTTTLKFKNRNVYEYSNDYDSLFTFIDVSMDETGTPLAINQILFNPATMKEVRSKSVKFTDEQKHLLEDAVFQKEVGKIKYSPSNRVQVFPRSDMGYYIVVENAYEDKSNYAILKHYAFTVSVIAIDSNFTLEWITPVRKRQFSKQNGRYSSYQLIHNDDNVCIVYNENPRNTGTDYLKYQEANTNFSHTTVVAMAHINRKGELKKYTLSKSTIPGKGDFDTFSMFRISSDEILFTTTQPKQYTFGKFKLE